MDPRQRPVPAESVWEKRDPAGKGGRKQMLSWAYFVAAEENRKYSTDYWIKKRGIFFHRSYNLFSSDCICQIVLDLGIGV